MRTSAVLPEVFRQRLRTLPFSDFQIPLTFSFSQLHCFEFFEERLPLSVQLTPFVLFQRHTAPYIESDMLHVNYLEFAFESIANSHLLLSESVLFRLVESLELDEQGSDDRSNDTRIRTSFRSVCISI